MVWNELLAINLFFAGLGGWTFIFTFLASSNDEKYRKVKLVGTGISIITVGLGAMILAVDAHGGLLNPNRYFFLLSNLNSVMAWGVIFISLFIIGAVIVWIMLFKKKNAPVVLEAITAILGLCVSIYTGVLLGTSPAFPLWSLSVLPIAFMISAADAGYGTYMLTRHYTKFSLDNAEGTEVKDVEAAKSTENTEAAKSTEVQAKAPAISEGGLRKLGIILPILFAIALAALLMVVSSVQGDGAIAAKQSITNLIYGNAALVFWIGTVIMGVVVPLVVALMPKKNVTPGLNLAKLFCILVGSFTFRYVIIVAAVPIFIN